MNTRRPRRRPTCRLKWILLYLSVQITSLSLFLFIRNVTILDSFGESGRGDIDVLRLESGRTCTLTLNDNDITVHDCYLYDLEERLEISKRVYQIFRIDYHSCRRSIQSISSEMLAHKIAYHLGIWTEHAKDATIDMEEDSRWYVVAVYKTLQIFGL